MRMNRVHTSTGSPPPVAFLVGELSSLPSQTPVTRLAIVLLQGQWQSVPDGRGHAGLRLRRAAEFAAVMPDQGQRPAPRSRGDDARTAGLSSRALEAAAAPALKIPENLFCERRRLARAFVDQHRHRLLR